MQNTIAERTNMQLEPMMACKIKTKCLPKYIKIFSKYDTFVFLGEIKNMEGRGVFALINYEPGIRQTVFSGYVIDDFEDIEPD